MAELLLSDIDGTLVDNALHADAWRRAFEHFGIQIGLDEAWRQIGKGGDHLIPVFLPEADRERLERVVKEFRKELFRREYMPRVVSFARSRDLLARVKESGKTIALATSSDDEEVAIYKKIVGMNDLIDDASSSADAQASKPEPDIFAAALRKVGMRAEQAIALGDTPYDVEAAGKLGIATIGVTCGGWKREDLLAAGCVEVYQHPEDLFLNFSRSALAK